MTSRKLASLAAVVMLVLSVIGVPFVTEETAPVAQAQTTEEGPLFGADAQCVQNPEGPKPLKGLGILIDMSTALTPRFVIVDDDLTTLKKQLRTLIYDYSQNGGDFVSVYIYQDTSPAVFSTDFTEQWETAFANIKKELEAETAVTIEWNPANEKFFNTLRTDGRRPPRNKHNWEAGMKRIVNDQNAGWFYTDVINIVSTVPSASDGTKENPTGSWVGPPKGRAIDFYKFMEQKKLAEEGGAFVQTIGVTTAFHDNYELQWWTEDGREMIQDSDLPTKAVDLMHVASSERAKLKPGLKGRFISGLTDAHMQTVEPVFSDAGHIVKGGFPGIQQEQPTCLTLTVGKDDGSGNITLDKSDRMFQLDTSVKTSFSDGEETQIKAETVDGIATTSLAGIQQEIRTALPAVSDDYESTKVPVCYASDDGVNWNKLDVGDSTPTELVLDAPSEAKVNCQFTVRKTTTLTLEKKVLSDPNIKNELDSDKYGQYHFAYTCKDEKSNREFSGLFSPVRMGGIGSDYKELPPMQLPATIPADPNDPSSKPAQIPVGAECTFVELQPRTVEGYFSHTTEWTSNNDNKLETGTGAFPDAYPTVKEREPVGECGLVKCDEGYRTIDRDTTKEKENPTVKFVVKPKEGANGVTVTSSNVYKSPKTRFKASVRITNPDILGKDKPAKVNITYSCRYIPSADKRPEIADNPDQYPVFSDSYFQSVDVSDDGTAETVLGDFPVGTQCEVNTLAPDEKKDSPLIDGYSYTATWTSRSCMKQNPEEAGYTDTPQKCSSNYIYAYSKPDEGNKLPMETETVNGVPMDVHKVRADLTFKRITRTLNIAKKVEGSARGDALTREFPATLKCMDTKYKDEVTYEERLTLKADTTLPIKVPARSTCTVTEVDPNPEGSRLAITAPAPVPIDVATSSTDSIPVTITNKVEDRYSPVTWTYNLAENTGQNQVSPEAWDKLQTFPMDFKTACKLPNGDEFETTHENVAPNETFNVEIPEGVTVNDRWKKGNGLPHGTQCITTYVRPNLKDADIAAQVKPSGKGTDLGNEITVDGSKKLDATVGFETTTSSIRITVSHMLPGVPDEDEYIPQKYEVEMTCSKPGRPNAFWSTNISVGAKDEDPWVDFSGVPNDDTTCTVVVRDGKNKAQGDADWQNVFNRTTAITTGPPKNYRVTIPPAEGDSTEVSATSTPNSVTFTGTLNTNSGAVTLDFKHTYTPITQQLTVEKDLKLTGNDPSLTENQQLRDAIFGAGKQWHIETICTRNEKHVFEQGGSIGAGQSADFNVPVGADCTVEETAEEIAGVTGPSITYESSNTFTAAKDQPPHKITVKNEYGLLLGQINLKKKVDGTGVSTVNGARKFEIGYTCKLGDWEKHGNFTPTRFDKAKIQDFQALGIPVGAVCTFTEDPASSKNPEDLTAGMIGDASKADAAYYSRWSTRWNVTPQQDGFGTETRCADDPNCDVTPISEHPAQAAYRVNDTGFNTTLILWNTYDYVQVPLKFKKVLAGDAERLGKAHDLGPFTVDYSCTHPAWATSDLKERHDQGDKYIPNPTITGRVTLKPGEEMDSMDIPYIPGNFVCTVTEQPVKTFDGDVTVAFDGVDYDGVEYKKEITTPDKNSRVKGNQIKFQIDPSKARAEDAEWKFVYNFQTNKDGATGSNVLSGKTQEVTITNNYQRPRASLTANFGYESGVPGDVSQWITNPDVGITVTGSCEDPDVPGTVDKIDGTLKPNGEVVPLSDDIIARSKCTFSTNATSKVPEGYTDVVQVTEKFDQYAGEKSVAQGELPDPQMQNLVAKPNSNKLEIRASYVVPQVNLALTKEVVGDGGKDIVGDSFSFGYTCAFNNLLPGQPLPEFWTANDSHVFSLKSGETWSEMVPTGSSCSVTEDSLSPDKAEKLKAANVQMSSYTVQGEEQNKVPTSEVKLAGENQHVTLVNAFYRTDAEVQVQKVQADRKTALGGSQFAIYQAAESDTDGELGELVATMTSVDGEAGKPSGTFTARLKPGTYYLVETKAPTGAALLPGAWKFEVIPSNPDEKFVDLEISLEGRTKNSGLVDITPPDHEKKTPAIIQVANILQGKLPLTGSYGVFWWILGGLVLIGAGLVWRRQKH